MNPFSLTSKTILVTGASSGIGKSVAEQCALAGACCVITARNEQRLKETLSMMSGEQHCALLADLGNAQQIEALVEQLPPLDGVICCAGVVETMMLKFTEETDLQHMFNSNTFSVIRLIRALIQQKKLNKEASVALISSISGTRCGYIGGALYGASKGALEGFIKATALELAPQKIRVNTIVPGMVKTHLLDKGDVSQEQLEADVQKYPLKRYGNPEEVAYAAVYLMSDATKWMTGTSLLIDGGYTLN